MVDNKFYVDIIQYGSDEPIETFGPFSERKAEKCDRGINININDDLFYTLIREVGGLKGE